MIHRGWATRLLVRPFALVFAAAAACGDGSSAAVVQAGDGDAQALFTRLPPAATGLAFENRLRDSRELNVFTYRNYYNGGGVGIGDLDGDGRPDVVMTSNQDGPKLFLNRGDFRFVEATRASGLRSARDSWTTGVLLADLDGDGRLDIYICKAGPLEPDERANELWINEGVNADGVPTFRERAAQLGVADDGYSIHAAVLDHDGDGDLDLIVINNSPRPVSSFGLRNLRHVRDPYGGAKLYRNDGTRFTDVSAAAGIHSPEIAFALGVVVSDVNRDGRPDIYVANDFFERDYLYVNRGDGTFAEALDRQVDVMSYFSMGLDVADLDNDGWPDVYTTDMLPEDEHRYKTTTMFEGWDVYQAKVRNGYHHQLMRNMLQRNNGDGTFTEVGQQAGVARTDWSWGALIADLDLDGLKDIYVTNGIARDITSQDYVAFLANEETMKSVTAGGTRRVDFDQLTRAMTSTPIPNYAFRNQGALRFTNQARAWGLGAPSFSNGVAYGDLDGDGAPDLVVNNVNGEAFVYRNNARARHPEHGSVRVRLEGTPRNRFAVGARVTMYADTAAFVQEQSPSRGFQSSVDYVLVFGLGTRTRADSVRVDWPDGRVSISAPVPVPGSMTIRHEEGRTRAVTPPRPGATLFSSRPIAAFTHRENAFVDFDRERLIPRMVSTEGPALAVADVNGDGLDDLYLGGAKGQPGQLLLQRRDGQFAASDNPAFADHAESEDVGATFVDVNGDGHADLYVVSGGSEFSDRAEPLRDRLYLNDGRGRFREARGALPVEYSSGSRVVAADYDADGDQDLFVGGRVVPWRYGANPRSALLRNDGRGRFADVTDAVAPGLADVGMVTDAAWADVDGDGRPELVVVGEWMPVTVFRNAGSGRLERMAVRGLERSGGWWNRVVARDVNGDRRVDLVLGNLGLNTRLTASPSRPATLYVKDFDNNGFVEQIIACYNGDTSYPIVLRDDLIRTIPSLKARFLAYNDYARKTVPEIFAPPALEDAIVRETHTFATSVALNAGRDAFTLAELPADAQVAPVFGIAVDDVDGDGRVDILLAGNFDGFKPEIGRASSGRGLLLRGDGRGGFSAVPPASSGFVVPGQARDVRRVRTASGPAWVVPRNDAQPLMLAPRRDAKALLAAGTRGAR